MIVVCVCVYRLGAQLTGHSTLSCYWVMTSTATLATGDFLSLLSHVQLGRARSKSAYIRQVNLYSFYIAL